MKQSILVVDDEIHMVTLLERILSEKTPYAFASTHNALEVPDLLETQKFDLLITDLRMPGLTGMDLLRQVCENVLCLLRDRIDKYNKDELEFLITRAGVFA